MRYNAVFKFLAIFLCALMLFGAVASGLGIFVLGSAGLYSSDVETLRREQLQIRAEGYGYFLAEWYGAMELGGCPEELAMEYYGYRHFYDLMDEGRLHYEILDWERNVLENFGEVTGNCFEIPISEWRYLRLVREVTEPSAPEETEGTAPLEEEAAGTEKIQVPEDATEASGLAAQEESVPTEAAQPSSDAAEEIEVSNDPSKGSEETLQEIQESTYPPMDPVDAFPYNIYDPQIGAHREFLLRYEDAPGVIVRVSFDESVAGDEQMWTLLNLVWKYRIELFWVLGSTLLLFAVLLVYLCCAAGHKPGRKEIRAGGLNRIPLDAYLAAGAIGITGLVLLAYEGGEYMLRQDLKAAVLVVALAGYSCTLIVTCFCFAFAAQVKTPGGFWWRNSLCGWCCRLIVVLWNLAVKILAWFWDKWIILFRWSWRFFQEKLVPLGKRLLRALWKLVRFFWNRLCLLLKKLWTVTRSILVWCGRKILRFIAMLPLTWQWLLAAFVMIFVLALTVNSYRAGLVLLGLGLTLALVLYGTSAFGTLLESAKRMRKGDLDTKVDETFLIGCFRDFAQELNGLADVAVVAAQKQLKSERMKTELITNVSHDIKTPLTSIINYVDLLEKPHTPEEQEIYLEVLSRQSQRLKKLIEDLMEMSKASTGNLAVEIEVVDAAETVNQALGEFADKLEKVPLNPVFKQPETPVLMLADGKLTWRVLSNLLSNAGKYALPGTRLYVDISQLDGRVFISLKNISREELNVEADELMERFVRGDASRNTEGSGLGLNIARSLMELQKGQLQLLVDGDLFKVTLIFPGAEGA